MFGREGKGAAECSFPLSRSVVAVSKRTNVVDLFRFSGFFVSLFFCFSFLLRSLNFALAENNMASWPTPHVRHSVSAADLVEGPLHREASAAAAATMQGKKEPSWTKGTGEREKERDASSMAINPAYPPSSTPALWLFCLSFASLCFKETHLSFIYTAEYKQQTELPRQTHKRAPSNPSTKKMQHQLDRLLRRLPPPPVRCLLAKPTPSSPIAPPRRQQVPATIADGKLNQGRFERTRARERREEKWREAVLWKKRKKGATALLAIECFHVFYLSFRHARFRVWRAPRPLLQD